VKATGSVSPRRADTRRNHERILAAAAESLATSDEVSFNAIAKKADVGVGTPKRGLAHALRAAIPSHGELPTSAYEALVGPVATLLEANVEAGTVRADLHPETVLRGLGGLLYLDRSGDWKNQTAWLTDLLWRGLHDQSS
jgi:hypothetical protein